MAPHLNEGMKILDLLFKAQDLILGLPKMSNIDIEVVASTTNAKRKAQLQFVEWALAAADERAKQLLDQVDVRDARDRKAAVVNPSR